MSERDPRLWLKCCGATTKEECSWAPCPANVDAWTGAELSALAANDEHRVDDAIAIFTRETAHASAHGSAGEG